MTSNALNPLDTTPLNSKGRCVHGRRHERFGCEYHPVYSPPTDEERAEWSREREEASRRPPVGSSLGSSAMLSLDELRELATDADPSVRKNVARNPKTKGALLTRLLKDVNRDVRAIAVSNSNATRRQRESMLNDPDDFVRGESRRVLGMPSETWDERAAFHVDREVMKALLADCDSVAELRDAIKVDARLTIGQWSITQREDADEIISERPRLGTGRWLLDDDGRTVFVTMRGSDRYAVTDVRQPT